MPSIILCCEAASAHFLVPLRAPAPGLLVPLPPLAVRPAPVPLAVVELAALLEIVGTTPHLLDGPELAPLGGGACVHLPPMVMPR